MNIISVGHHFKATQNLNKTIKKKSWKTKGDNMAN